MILFLKVMEFVFQIEVPCESKVYEILKKQKTMLESYILYDKTQQNVLEKK